MQLCTTKFYSSEVRTRWNNLKTHEFTLDKCVVDVEDLKTYNLDAFLHQENLLRSVTYVKPYVADLVHEFYANLEPIFFYQKSSPYFGKVYIRGRMITITLTIINSFLGRSDTIDAMVNDDLPTMARVLTRTKVHNWKASGKN